MTAEPATCTGEALAVHRRHRRGRRGRAFLRCPAADPFGGTGGRRCAPSGTGGRSYSRPASRLAQSHERRVRRDRAASRAFRRGSGERRSLSFRRRQAARGLCPGRRIRLPAAAIRLQSCRREDGLVAAGRLAGHAAWPRARRALFDTCNPARASWRCPGTARRRASLPNFSARVAWDNRESPCSRRWVARASGYVTRRHRISRSRKSVRSIRSPSR